MKTRRKIQDNWNKVKSWSRRDTVTYLYENELRRLSYLHNLFRNTSWIFRRTPIPPHHRDHHDVQCQHHRCNFLPPDGHCQTNDRGREALPGSPSGTRPIGEEAAGGEDGGRRERLGDLAMETKETGICSFFQIEVTPGPTSSQRHQVGTTGGRTRWGQPGDQNDWKGCQERSETGWCYLRQGSGNSWAKVSTSPDQDSGGGEATMGSEVRCGGRPLAASSEAGGHEGWTSSSRPPEQPGWDTC
jgi:hypothetical protein